MLLQISILWIIILSLLASRSAYAQDHSVESFATNSEDLDNLSDQNLSTIVGLHVIYSWPGATIPQDLLDLTQEGKVGGVIIFGENVNDDLPNQIANLQSVYKKSPGYIGRPLLITTDQEGGIVVRLPGGPKKTAKEVGSSRNPAAAASKAGVVAANACKAYNVNGNVLNVWFSRVCTNNPFCRKSSSGTRCLPCGGRFR
jgi:beta-glucosidase-like glycosyl hydrolase